MDRTPASLLERLRRPGEREAWDRFVQLYTPLLYSWACRLGLQEQDKADLVQDIFATLLREMPEFRYDPDRSFRGWLRTVVVNRWRTACRRRTVALREGEAGLDELAAPDLAAEVWEEEYRQQVAARALELMRVDFEPTTWQACWEMAANGRPAAEVAVELGITVAAAYTAKSRVLRRLREEFADLFD